MGHAVEVHGITRNVVRIAGVIARAGLALASASTLALTLGLPQSVAAPSPAPHPQARTQTAPAAAPDTTLTLDPTLTKVHWSVDSTLHLLHGTFALQGGSVRFDPATGKASGEIVVLAPSGESGNGSRDARMNKEILETAKYPEIVFHPQQIEGTVGASGVSAVKLRGVFSIHGADHDLTADIHAEIAGGQWKGTAKFDVPYVQWGIKDPSNFLLKVKPVVSVEIEMAGAVEMAK